MLADCVLSLLDARGETSIFRKLIRPHTRTTKGNKMYWNMWQPKITAFNNDSVMQLLPCFQRLFAVLEECLLGGACAFVSIGGQKSPQSSSAPEGKSSCLCRGAGWGYCRETLNLCPPALHKQFLEKSIEDKPGLWGVAVFKGPYKHPGPSCCEHSWAFRSTSQGGGLS